MDEQIARLKARHTKKRLSYYGFALSLILTLAALSQGLNLSTLLTTCLILPLPLYFGLQSLKFYRKSQTQMEPLTSGLISESSSQFSLWQFLSQPNWAFRLSCLLFFMVLFTTLARLRSPNSPTTISHHAPPNTQYQIHNTN